MCQIRLKPVLTPLKTTVILYNFSHFIQNRQIELIRLEPEYQTLLRDRAILENQLRSLTVREGEERIKRSVTQADFDNIQILEPARPPAQRARP